MRETGHPGPTVCVAKFCHGVVALLCLIVGATTALHAAEPAVVAVGKGSYAEFPPPQAGDVPREMTARKLYLVEPNNRPIPTNDWWTNLIIDRYAGHLWAFPLMVTANERGLNVFFPTRWNEAGTELTFRIKPGHTCQDGTPKLLA